MIAIPLVEEIAQSDLFHEHFNVFALDKVISLRQFFGGGIRLGLEGGS